MPERRTVDPERYRHQRVEFGGLRLGQSRDDVAAILGPAPVAGPPEEDVHEFFWIDWHYPEMGVELTFLAARRAGPWTLDRIRATAPCTLRTDAGIGIGDPGSAPAKIYVDPHDFVDAEPGDRVPDLGADFTFVPAFRVDPATQRIDEIIIDADGC